jgi:hypothetical protein
LLNELLWELRYNKMARAEMITAQTKNKGAAEISRIK